MKVLDTYLHENLCPLATLVLNILRLCFISFRTVQISNNTSGRIGSFESNSEAQTVATMATSSWHLFGRNKASRAVVLNSASPFLCDIFVQDQSMHTFGGYLIDGIRHKYTYIQIHVQYLFCSCRHNSTLRIEFCVCSATRSLVDSRSRTMKSLSCVK